MNNCLSNLSGWRPTRGGGSFLSPNRQGFDDKTCTYLTPWSMATGEVISSSTKIRSGLICCMMVAAWSWYFLAVSMNPFDRNDGSEWSGGYRDQWWSSINTSLPSGSSNSLRYGWPPLWLNLTKSRSFQSSPNLSKNSLLAFGLLLVWAENDSG